MRRQVRGWVRATLRTRRRRVVLALLVLIALAAGGYAITAHGATSLEVIAWSHVEAWQEGTQPPPDAKVFDKTFEDLGLVHDMQELLDGAPRGIEGGCTLGSPTYAYEFRFATVGITTQVYTGVPNCVIWQHPLLGIYIPILGDVGVSDATLDALHERTGMPLPKWVTASEGSDVADRI
jgi:hypothetical protein